MPAVVLAVLVSALVGGLFGSTRPGAGRIRSSSSTASSPPRSRRSIGEYVEPVPSDRLVYGAIDGMLHTLDPHSSFFDPKQYAQMRERQEGSYYGLGISIQVVDGDITVVSLFEGSPAYRAGIRRGDVIARIEGEDTKNWTSDQAVQAAAKGRRARRSTSRSAAPATTS